MGVNPKFGVKLGVGSVKTFFFFFWSLLEVRGKLDLGRREGLIELRLTVSSKFLMITLHFKVITWDLKAIT